MRNWTYNLLRATEAGSTDVKSALMLYDISQPVNTFAYVPHYRPFVKLSWWVVWER